MRRDDRRVTSWRAAAVLIIPIVVVTSVLVVYR